MSEWSKQDRFNALLSGERADRPIGSGWRHFIDKEQTADDLAETTISFTKNMIGIGSRLIQERLIWRKLGGINTILRIIRPYFRDSKRRLFQQRLVCGISTLKRQSSQPLWQSI